MKAVKQWWGPIDGGLHLFDCWEYETNASIRSAEKAACGWVPPMGVMESPEDLPPARLCPDCQRNCPHGRLDLDRCADCGKVFERRRP